MENHGKIVVMGQQVWFTDCGNTARMENDEPAKNHGDSNHFKILK